jgi:hypothetical protein
MKRVTGPEVMNAWNDVAKEHGFQKCLVMTTARMNQLRARNREAFFLEHWRTALDLVAKEPWFRGQNPYNWVANIEWFLRPNTVPRLMEKALSEKPRTSKHEQTSTDFKY